MRLDLHVHTVASDGAWSAERVVAGAVEGRLDVVAIADHDTVAGVEPAVQAAQGLHIEVVPACELSSTRDGREIHVLGLFLDPAAPPILRHQERAASLRIVRMEAMIARLAREGVSVTMDRVLAAAGPERHIVGRPHLARAMVEAGHVATVPEAFDRWIGDAHPAFVPTDLMDPVEAVDVVLRSGGIPVWAHPPADLVDVLLPDLVAAGLRGLEVYRPFVSTAQVRRLKAVARTSGLLLSGGSDWHDPERNGALGTFYVAAREVAPLLKAVGM